MKNITEAQNFVMSFYYKYGRMTDEQLAQRIARANANTAFPTIQLSPSGIRTRRKELVDKGLLRNSGIKLALASSRMAIVWEIAK